MFSIQLLRLLNNHILPGCTVWNGYGPAEITFACTFYPVKLTTDTSEIPLGLPLPNYNYVVMDEVGQRPVMNEAGELYVGGVGVFSGYLGRDDLSTRAMVNINGQSYYRSGDLVRIDSNGLLHYVGRKDFQVKLHGQRIELGEIERCLLGTTITACVVTKWREHHLVAYVQSSETSETQLREYCQSHLPPHMVPSMFIILDKLPLNANGKVDRKKLPPPHSHHGRALHSKQSTELPTTDTERIVHRIWCDILHQDDISIDTSIFTIGGHSLLIMQFLHRYKTQFNLEPNTLSIADLFQNPTITGHAQLIQQATNTTYTEIGYHWLPLHAVRGKNRQLASTESNVILALLFL